MTIEICTRIVKKKDLSLGPNGITYHAPYIPIYQYGYGRMDASSPGQGLATSGVASCLAIVFHCSATGRTILTHSPNFLYMTTFVPIVDWITGGEGQDLDLRWRLGVGTRPCEVEVVVLRGFIYATPLANTYGHADWMKDFEIFFSSLTGSQAIHVNILDAPRVLSLGTVLVDKVTARITYLQSGIQGRRRIDYLNIENLSLPRVYSRAQRDQDLFVGMLLGEQNECPPISLQYDISEYRLPLALTDEGRQLIRSKRLKEPSTSQSAIIRQFGQSSDWISLPGDSLIRQLFFTLAAGSPCERCGDPGSRRCTACKGAWYCGEQHQKDDWAAHKAWYKAHPMAK